MDRERWPADADDAVALQNELRGQVRQVDVPGLVRAVAGVDVAYIPGSDRVVAAAVVLDAESLDVVDEAVVHGTATVPYRPGLLAFRELPVLLEALGRLSASPDLVVCDGHGLAHPRRFGLACHLGVLTGLRAIGVAKTPYGVFDQPGTSRGSWTEQLDGTDVVGRVVRTQPGRKPVFVSVGHQVTLDSACDQVLRLCPRYRLPETTRRSDHLARHHAAATVSPA